MGNIYDYLDKYGNKTFEELEYTEVDNVVFTQISYLNLYGIVSNNEDKIRLEDAINIFFKMKRTCFIKKVVSLLKTIKDMPRYKDLLLSNYIYKLTDNEQFGALTIDINKDLRCVVFEGTDDTMIGWREDFAMAYKDYIPSSKDATLYLNKVSKKSKNIIVTGHSKGGYLSLVAAINANFLTKLKIKKIYSLDGPGINKDLIESNKFKNIKNRYIKIIPKCSIIGKLFYDIDNPIVCDTRVVGLTAHSVFKWIIEDNKFRKSKPTKFSTDINNNLTVWIESYTKEEIEYFSNYIFDSLYIFNIKTTYDFINIDSDTNIKILKYLEKTDSKIKKMLLEFLSYIKSYYKNEINSKLSPILDIYNKLKDSKSN